MGSCSNAVLLLMLAVPSLVCVMGVWLMAREHRERARTHTRRKEDRRPA